MHDINEDETPERRDHRRHPLPGAMTFRQAGRGRVSAALADASTHGLQLRAHLERRDDHEYWLRIPGLESQLGILCWSQGNRHGFRLVNPLHPAVLDRLLGEAHDAAAPAAPPAARMPANDDVQAAPDQDDRGRREKILGGQAYVPSILNRKDPRAGGRMLGTMIRRQGARATDHRLEPRYPPPEHGARLQVANCNSDVLDLSASGMRIEQGLVSGAIGDEVTVAFENCGELSGRIVWMRDGMAGLSLPPHAIDLQIR